MEQISDIFLRITLEIIECKPSSFIRDRGSGGKDEYVPRILNILWFIYGLCKKDFSVIPDIGTSFTDPNSDIQKIIVEFFGILRKYNSNIFTGKFYNIPDLNGMAEGSFYYVKRRLEDPDFKLFGQFPSFVAQGGALAKDAAEDAKEKVKEKATELADYVRNSSTSYIKEVMYKDLFKMFDLDQTGSLCFAEFQDLSKYMGIQMDNERALRMFSIADKNKDNSITLDEFPEIMKLLTEQIAHDTLRNLNLTSRDLIMFAVLTLTYLVLALIFIFFGIFTFSRADGFSAVINSIMPLIAGGVAALRSMDLYERVEHVKEYIEEFIRKMRMI